MTTTEAQAAVIPAGGDDELRQAAERVSVRREAAIAETPPPKPSPAEALKIPAGPDENERGQEPDLHERARNLAKARAEAIAERDRQLGLDQPAPAPQQEEPAAKQTPPPPPSMPAPFSPQGVQIANSLWQSEVAELVARHPHHFSDVTSIDQLVPAMQAAMWDADFAADVANTDARVIVGTARLAQEEGVLVQKAVAKTKAALTEFVQEKPEYARSDKLAWLERHAEAYYRSVGWSDAEIATLRQTIAIEGLDKRAWRMLHNCATLHSVDEARKAGGTQRPVPPVQRPGTTNDRPSHGELTAQDARKRLRNEGTVASAVAALQAKRAAR